MSEASLITNKLATDKIGKLILSYSLPAIVGTVVMALYNIVDRIFIGQLVGEYAISGLALTFPFMNILTAFGMLIGAGAASRISITLGSNDQEKAESILANAFILTFIVSGVVIAIAYIFMSDLLRVFGGTDSTIGYAEEYMRVIIPGSIFSALNYAFNNIMRASGYPFKAMITMIICAVLNIILDAVFLLVFNAGIGGVAWATNISFMVGTIWVLSHFLRSKTIIRFRKERFKLKWEIVKSILSIGMSPFSLQAAMSFVVVVINLQLIKHGSDLSIGAYSVIHSITTLIIMSIVGLNQGLQPIVGYNYGAGLYKRMFKVLRTGIVIATVISIAGFLPGMLIPEYIARAFTPHTELINEAAKGLKLVMLAFPIIGFQIVTTNFFQSIGKAGISIFLSLSRQFVFIVPCLLILPNYLGQDGVWLSQPVSDVLATVCAGLTLFIFIRNFKKATTTIL